MSGHPDVDDHQPVTRTASGNARRLVLPPAAAFWLVAAALFLMLFASGAASPLYSVYQAQWRFSATTLTAVFAVYALVLLVALLVLGSVSDYLGRRRVIAAAAWRSAGRGRVRAVPRGARRRPAVRRPGAAGRSGLTSRRARPSAALIDLQPDRSQRRAGGPPKRRQSSWA